MSVGPQSGSADQSRVLRWALLGGAFMMIVVGVLVFLMIDRTAGIVVGAIGVLDLLTLRFVLGAIERSRGTDPSYNSYARED